MTGRLSYPWYCCDGRLVLLAALLCTSTASAVTLNVVGSDGADVAGFRWLAQEDTTYPVVPGVLDPYTVSLRLHTSYAPPVLSGHSTGSSAEIALPGGKRYFISVLPDAGYSMGGSPYDDTNGGAVTVRVAAQPIPTAQISVFVFEDTQPLDNWPEPPAEKGLAGFKVAVYDAGGRFGMSGGQMMMDAFGNMLGTTYDDQGIPTTHGNGFFTTDETGVVRIKNLPPGKFTVQVLPPAGEAWIQTNTIEGGKGIDAWVKPDEPPFWREFAPNFYHVHFGFIRPTNDTSVLNGTNTIKGEIVNLHLGRHPNSQFFPGHPWPAAWVGLNVAPGRAIYAGPCKEDSTFEIPNVPAGEYELVVWDENLDIIITFQTVIVPEGAGTLDIGPVMAFDWFGHCWNYVFEDDNENGFPDPGEEGLPEVPTNIRWRDGTIYQAFPTDLDGYVPYDEVFPFFHWQVMEVGFARQKATGVTVVVDDGGAVLPDQGWTLPTLDRLNPQAQTNPDGSSATNPNTGNNLSRTETGPVLLEAFQVFQGQTNVFYWGKSNYDKIDTNAEPPDDFPGPGDVDLNGNGIFDHSNGGIAGIVYYASTRAEDDPRFAAAEPWEPGIPRVQVVLYADNNHDTFIDDLDGSGGPTLADVDNYPFDWSTLGQKGPEDVNRTGAANVFDWGDAMNIVGTDSWDDNPPTNAQGPPFSMYGVDIDTYDGLRNWNQVRPGVFDGGYAFTSYFRRTPDFRVDKEVPGLPEGDYIIEAVPPPNYEVIKPEDRNVDFGDPYVSAAKAGELILNPPCVGDNYVVPAELSLFPGEPCPLAGQTVRKADRREVTLSAGLNAACDFFFFTPVPPAAQIVGMLLDDVANERNPLAPTFGEKYAPPWIPISIRDWTGHEITRMYADQWGNYNCMVPSTYSANLPIPSGMAPNMLSIVLNSPGPILDKNPGSPTHGQYVTDPYFNRKYGQIGLTFQYMPGCTTYLDTPIVRIGAFPNLDDFPVDVQLPDGTPVIWSVENGPYAAGTGQIINIVSAGQMEVDNPFYDGTQATPKRILRDYGFGTAPGTVTINGVPLQGPISWTNDAISGTIAPGTTTGQLKVTKANGNSSVMGITFTVGLADGTAVHNVVPSAKQGATPIQDAIDIAQPGDLILVAPGVYEELVIVWKPVQLQGWGAGSTFINAVRNPIDKLAAWKAKLEQLVMTGAVDLLPGQVLNFDEVSPGSFASEEGAGILVVARNLPPADGGFGADYSPRIDGFTVLGADVGGGICVNGYARHLQISNNSVIANRGTWSGGIRVGHPDLTVQLSGGPVYDSCHSEYVQILNNHVAGNGCTGGAGGGIGIFAGADNYRISGNYVVGNFTTGQGAGIGHVGLSNKGQIDHNTILYNQSFNQGIGNQGGGIYIAGAMPLQVGGLSPGAGSVVIDANFIQGNLAGSGHGGGIRLESINGLDVGFAPNNPDAWFSVDILNNIITNNIAALAGAGISMQDAVKVNIVHNTVVRNDSTATGGEAMANPNQSTPQPSGIVANAHSPALAAVFGADPVVLPYATFSNPVLINCIVHGNRSFYYVNNPAQNPQSRLVPAVPMFSDLAVVGTDIPLLMTPKNCLLSDLTGYAGNGNQASDPQFDTAYWNGAPGQNFAAPGWPALMEVALAADEGGNFIDVIYGPLTLLNPGTGLRYGNCHLTAASPAVGLGQVAAAISFGQLARDFDGKTRPSGLPDSGACEQYSGGAAAPAPGAVDDAFTGRAGLLFSAIRIPAPGVLANDVNPAGGPLQAVLVQNAQHGTVMLSPNGSFTYVAMIYQGTDSFKYYATNGANNSNVATVTLRITATGNRAPVAVPDSYTTLPNTALSVSAPGVKANDTDADVDTFAPVLVTPPQHGTLALRVNGSFLYTPAAGFVGTDTFWYRDYDGVYGAAATVTIAVTGPPVEQNLPPVPTALPIHIFVDKTGITRVVPNDPNLNDYHTFSLMDGPANGTAELSPTGIVKYTPNAGYVGMDMIMVHVTDAAGATAMAMVDIMVMAHGMTPPAVTLQCPPDTDGIDTDGDGDVANDNLCQHLGAGDGFINMADGKLAYTFGFSDLNTTPLEETFMQGMLAAEEPAPTLKFKEGQKVYLNLTNIGMAARPDLFDPHSVHFHGFPQAAPVFDGVPDASVAIKMGGTFTYFYYVLDPGTYLYHCHVEATEHMQMGMMGNLWVTPKQDGHPYTWGGRTYTKFAYNDGDGSTGYNIDYPVQLMGFDPTFHDASFGVQPLPFALMRDKYHLMNGRGYPDTVVEAALPAPSENGGKASQKINSVIRAVSGQRVLLRLSNLNVTRFYTLTSPSLQMQVVGHDARQLKNSVTGAHLYYTTSSITVGGGESRDIIVDTLGVPPGTYFLYCSNLDCLSNDQQDFGGIMTEIVIE